jgi:hypothetical protein
VAQNFRPRLQFVGEAVAEPNNCVARRKGQLVDARGEVGVGEEFLGRLLRIRVELRQEIAIRLYVDAVEPGERLVVEGDAVRGEELVEVVVLHQKRGHIGRLRGLRRALTSEGEARRKPSGGQSCRGEGEP